MMPDMINCISFHLRPVLAPQGIVDASVCLCVSIRLVRVKSYRQLSDISCTKTQNLNVSRHVL